MQRILISACLLGQKVRYHGGDALVEHPLLTQWAAEGRLVPICPELLAGLPTPRPASELSAGRVITATGSDLTDAYHRGATLALHPDIRLAILKNGSPSCGSSFVYDGTFTGRVVPGEGVTAALLRAHGVAVFSEEEIEAAGEFLATLRF